MPTPPGRGAYARAHERAVGPKKFQGFTEQESCLIPFQNRVGGGITPAVLPHHRTYGSVYGGS